MQIASRTQRPVVVAGRRAAVVPPARSAAAHVRTSRVVAYAADAGEASTSTEEPAATSNGASPVERARAALQQDTVDKAELEGVLAELEAEMSRLQEGASAAEARAATAEASVATAKDQLVRLSADFENFRRRTKDEKDALKDSVRGDMVADLLPVVDNFELARTQVKAETEGEIKINNSYQSLYKQFVDFLRGLGVEAVPTVGTPFDPALHEAIMREENEDHPDGTVLQEFRKGFRIGDKLLRPAMVKVSVNDSPSSGASADSAPSE